MFVINSRLINTLIFLIIYVLSSHTVVLQDEVGEYCTISNTGESGVCRSIYQCRYAMQQYDQYRIRPTRCGFSGNTPIVCCVEVAPQNQQNRQPAPIPSRGKRISEKKCDEYSSQVSETVVALPLLPDAVPISFQTEKCEFGSTELIVGGHDAKLGEFPHMAAIGWEKINSDEYSWNCGGTLISDRFVLTAAHCTYLRNSEVANPSPSMVRLGEHNIASRNDGANPYDIPVERIITHPQYAPPSNYHDIALIKLQNSIVNIQSKFIRPACLWTKPTITDKVATAIGWGATKHLGLSSDILQSVSLNIIDKATCSRFYNENRKLDRGIINEQLCAGNFREEKDTCQGDSGGPLQVYSKTNRCIHYLIGLTSFGKGCGTNPGVYTKINSYIDWIEQTVWPNES